MTTGNRRARLAASTILTGLATAAALAFALPAQAQEATPAEPGAALGDVIVTGSRIVRQDYVANSPIVTVDAEDIQKTGSITIDTLINELPQFTPATNATSNNPSNGGQANVQLRGLQPARTLVLLNGRRIVPSNSSSIVDLNLIPSSLVRSVETITGGASSTYGSDAVAGVLNFILNDRFEGLMFDAQIGQTDRSDGETEAYSLTLGSEMADGRGRMVLNLGYANRAEIYNQARDFSSISGFSANSPLGNTIFDGTNLPSAAAVAAAVAGSVPGDTFGFNNDGTLFIYRGAVDYRSPGGIDYDGFRVPGPLQSADFAYNTGPLNYMILPQDRYNLFVAGSYDLFPNVEFYTEALFSQYTTENVLAATPATGSTTGFRVPVTNPFIPTELAAVLASRPNPAGTFRLDKRFNALGPRKGAENYDVYQLTTGFRGDLPGTRDWSYDLYASYGRVDNVTTQSGNVSRSQVQRLLEAADGGVSLCAGGFDPFGETALSPACAAFIGRLSKNTMTNEQITSEVSLQGGLFDLPGGEVRVALGAAYREQTYAFVPDALLSSTFVLNGVTGPDVAGFNASNPLSGRDRVYEGFAELLVPIAKDLPFIRSMELNLGYRVSDYESVGAVESYKADGNWQIIDSLRLRGGIQRAVRAPSIGELFAPQNLSFPNIGVPVSTGGVRQFSGDPCDVRGAYRDPANAARANAVRALCLAQGVPNGVIDTYTYTNQQMPGFVGGNGNLAEETADSFTVGMVYDPSFSSPWLSSFTVSLDYYSIEIEDVIGTVSASEQLRRCYNFDGESNPTYSTTNFYCTLFQRDPASGQAVNAIELNNNLGVLRTSGYDLQVDWRWDLEEVGMGPWGQLAFNVTANYLENWERQDLPGAAFTDRRGTASNSLGLTLPEWKVLSSIDWTFNDFSLGVRYRRINEVENFNNRATTIPTQEYWDLNGSWRLTDNLSFRAGVNNVGDQLAPVYTPSVASSTDPSTYDVLGRRYYLGLNARF